MARYRVTMMEKTYYEIYVEANNQDDAKEIAEDLLADAEVTDQFISDICVEEAVE